jgi:drug/metabolite transporter (DMT)-like permease
MPGAVTLGGFGLALLAICLIAGTGGSSGTHAGLGLAMLAGCGFGIFFILLHRAGASAVFWPLVAARIGSLGLVLPLVLGRRQLALGDSRLLVQVLLSGALAVAGDAFFVLAGQAGRLDVAAILASLYPASTVMLAALLLGERLTRAQFVGILAALVAIALIAS